MLSHLMTQLLRSFGIFFRTIRAFVTRRLVGIWARVRRMTNLSRQATRIAADSMQSVAALAKKPSGRSDYIETKRLLIAKKLLLLLTVGLIAAALLVYFVVWPFVLSRFLTARFYVQDSRIGAWSGRVIVYSDEQKTIPLYEGKLVEGLLQGKGIEYDAQGMLSYEGFFVNGVREGKGTAYEQGVIVYEGDFSADVYEGVGRRYADGILNYEGMFSNGLPNGEGVSYYADRTIQYKGRFVNGLYEGTGTAYTTSGRMCYQGSFAQGVYNGQGKLYPAQGQRIEATFADGQPDGTIAWYKDNVLYYQGQVKGMQPSGYGTLYAPSGKIIYQGQMADGTLDGEWLVNQTADDLRAALGEQTITEYPDVLGGFVVSAPAIGLAALCSYQTEEQQAMVRAVYLAQPQQKNVCLLPGQDFVALDAWGTSAAHTRTFSPIPGISLTAGSYQSKRYTRETCQAEVLYKEQELVLLMWSKTGTNTGQSSNAASVSKDDVQVNQSEQERLETFLASLDQMDVPQETVLQNLYYGNTALSHAFSGCQTAEQAADVLDALCDYWVSAEKRLGLEQNRERTQTLLEDERASLARGTGDAQAVEQLTAQVQTLDSAINQCISQMAKASIQAQTAGGADPQNLALSGLAALFHPAALDVQELSLVATAYAQSQATSEQQVDGPAIALSVKTALTDLTTAYSAVQSARTACETAVSTSSQAAGMYAMGQTGKSEWYQALSAQEDAQTALCEAVGAFVKQANALNQLTGGWVCRTQDWLTDELEPFYTPSE